LTIIKDVAVVHINDRQQARDWVSTGEEHITLLGTTGSVGGVEESEEGLASKEVIDLDIHLGQRLLEVLLILLDGRDASLTPLVLWSIAIMGLW